MRDDVMWAWDYELRTLGSWPGERYTGHNVPVEVVTKADHDAALRRAKAEGVRMAAELVRDDCYIDGGELLPDYEHRCKHNVNQKELAAKLDARAAQIEEGE